MFDRDDPGDLVDKITTLLEDERVYGRKVEECRGLAEEYDWDLISDKVEGVYEGVL